MEHNRHFLVSKTAIELMLNIKDDGYNYNLLRNKDISTPSHAFGLLKMFEDKGLIRTFKKKRIRHIYLTEKGRLIQEELFKIRETLKW